MLPELRTKRLLLKIAGPEFAAQRARYERENRAFHAPWSPSRPDEFFTEAFWRKQLSASQEAAHMGTRLTFTIFDERSDIVGAANFTEIVYGAFDACFLGYALAERAVGHGYMTEALSEALRYVFEDAGLHRVMANYMPVNERSAAVLRRLGFRVEGYARDYLRIDGRWRDHILTALHADEFAAKRASDRNPMS